MYNLNRIQERCSKNDLFSWTGMAKNLTNLCVSSPFLRQSSLYDGVYGDKKWSYFDIKWHLILCIILHRFWPVIVHIISYHAIFSG